MNVTPPGHIITGWQVQFKLEIGRSVAIQEDGIAAPVFRCSGKYLNRRDE
jgi:hypothetical protein